MIHEEWFINSKKILVSHIERENHSKSVEDYEKRVDALQDQVDDL